MLCHKPRKLAALFCVQMKLLTGCKLSIYPQDIIASLSLSAPTRSFSASALRSGSNHGRLSVPLAGGDSVFSEILDQDDEDGDVGSLLRVLTLSRNELEVNVWGVVL